MGGSIPAPFFVGFEALGPIWGFPPTLGDEVKICVEINFWGATKILRNWVIGPRLKSISVKGKCENLEINW